ncbi:MAG: hypothetical protein ACKERG_00860 [Candidatus Hodgkinia cicadicola]
MEVFVLLSSPSFSSPFPFFLFFVFRCLVLLLDRAEAGMKFEKLIDSVLRCKTDKRDA